MPGIGEQLSHRIEEHRFKHGPFQSLDDLTGQPMPPDDWRLDIGDDGVAVMTLPTFAFVISMK